MNSLKITNLDTQIDACGRLQNTYNILVAEHPDEKEEIRVYAAHKQERHERWFVLRAKYVDRTKTRNSP